MQFGGASCMWPEWMITVMALTFGGARHPRRRSDCLARTQSPHHFACFPARMSLVLAGHTTEAKSPAASWNSFMALRSVCDTRLGGTAWGRHKSMSAGELARSCCMRLRCPAEITASSSCRYFRKFRQAPRTGAGSTFMLERPCLAGHVPAGNDPQKHARR